MHSRPWLTVNDAASTPAHDRTACIGGKGRCSTGSTHAPSFIGLTSRFRDSARETQSSCCVHRSAPQMKGPACDARRGPDTPPGGGGSAGWSA